MPSHVSIPFKREGTFRQKRMLRFLGGSGGFQFPSNGNAHSDVAERKERSTKATRRFPFPSNGKAHSDFDCGSMPTHFSCVSIPFKREGTFRLTFSDHSCGMVLSFHSLQTGRHIQTVGFRICPRNRVLFPFPSNGKAHSD